LKHRPTKIISGGQTGADIGALVAAKKCKIQTGGHTPAGFKTEKGPQESILTSYGLVAHQSGNYSDRTNENVKNSGATIIVATNSRSAGTHATLRYCKNNEKPYLVVDPGAAGSV
jgi:Circularly permutated YpsA SLOG family